MLQIRMQNPSNWLKNTLFNLQKLIQEERKIGVQILDVLWEIERRKAYAELGYDGLFSFCVRELKFSESQAFQRIQAMHAMKTITEVREKIESGAMNVTTVSQVQVFLRQEKAQGIKRDPQQAAALMMQFENKTSKEVKVHLAELKGERLKTKLNIELDAEAEELWAMVRGQAAHSTGGDDLKCLKILMRGWLDQRTPRVRGASAKVQRTVSGLTKVERNTVAKTVAQKSSRYIVVPVRAEVRIRDQNKCTNCGSVHALQFDHRVAFANGGTNGLTNLQLLCRNCNLNKGVREFGVRAMGR